MGLFSGIGKVFGSALKVVGKVAGVAGAIAPIPGLGFAGKLAGTLGGALTRAKGFQRQLSPILRAASGAGMKPGVLAAVSTVMPGGSQARGIGGLVRAASAVRGASRVMYERSQGVTDPRLLALAAEESRAGTTYRDERGSYTIGTRGEVVRKKRRRGKKRASSRTSRRPRRRGGKRKLSAAQIRAGFGGKRRMKRR